jgi:hypothetical protein
MNSREYYRKSRRGLNTNNLTSANDKTNHFLSSIRRYRISTDESNRRYVEYEIASQFRISELRSQNDVVHKWSVWKRYSELDKLHQCLTKTLGWQMESLEFPSAYTFSLN